MLEIDEIKTVPDVPLSHPFVERLIGTIRREFLDHVPLWTSSDLERKLNRFGDYSIVPDVIERLMAGRRLDSGNRRE